MGFYNSLLFLNHCTLFFPAQVLTKGFGFHLRDLCNTTPLEEFVHISDGNVSRLTQEIICKSSSDWLNKAQSHFLSNLDFLKPIRVSLSANTSCGFTVDLITILGHGYTARYSFIAEKHK